MCPLFFPCSFVRQIYDEERVYTPYLELVQASTAADGGKSELKAFVKSMQHAKYWDVSKIQSQFSAGTSDGGGGGWAGRYAGFCQAPHLARKECTPSEMRLLHDLNQPDGHSSAQRDESGGELPSASAVAADAPYDWATTLRTTADVALYHSSRGEVCHDFSRTCQCFWWEGWGRDGQLPLTPGVREGGQAPSGDAARGDA